MPTVAVLADPPVPGDVLPALSGSVLGPEDAAQLYRAMLTDVCSAIQDAGAAVLLNHPPADRVAVDDPAGHLRERLADLLPAPGEVRYEVQVGESRAARVGNTVTHLLETEGVDSAAVLAPTAPFVSREQLGSAAMKLRSSPVVLGPASGGRVYYAGFTEPVDFADSFEPPALATLTDRGVDAGHAVDFVEALPVVETERDLAGAVARLRALERADRNRPAAMAAAVADLGLAVGPDGTGGLALQT